jgi:hypothetical protein
MKTLLVMVFLSLFCTQPALACDPKPDWRPPTPQGAYATASVVIHARVVSVQGADPWNAKVVVLRTLKGAFSGNTVETASHSLCGIGGLEVGKEYVFFFPHKSSYFVSHLLQPTGFTTDKILKALPLARN